MNAYPTRTIAALTLALTASISAQAGKKPVASRPATLAQAVVAEVYEHDLGKAMRLYDRIAKDSKQPATDREQALLRLAKAHRRLGQLADADRILKDVAKGDGNAAKEAQAILDGVVPNDGDLVKAKVDQVLKTMRLTGKPQTSELAWIGPAATPYVIKAVEAEKADLNFITNCARVLFSIGGDAVVDWVGRVKKSEDTLRKRAVLKGVGSPDDKVEKALLGFAQDPEASVRREFLTHAVSDYPTIVAMLDDKDEEIASLAMARIFNGWTSLLQEGKRLESFRALMPRLERLAVAPTGNPQNLGQWLGSPELYKQPRVFADAEDGRKILIEAVSFPCFRDVRLSWPSVGQGAEKNCFAGDILSAALRIGPVPLGKANRPNASGQSDTYSLARIINDCLPHWDRQSLPVVLKLVELGYGTDRGVRFGSWITSRCNKADAPKIMARMFDFYADDVTEICNWMIAQGAPAGVFGKLESIANQKMSTRSTARSGFGPDLVAVLKAIAEIGSEEAIDYCIERLRADEFRMDWLNQPSPGKRKLLEAVLTRPAKELSRHRGLAFRMLMTGYEQPGAPESFARAYQLGLGNAGSAGRSYFGLPAREMGGALFCFRRNPYSQNYGERKCDDATAAAILAACLSGGGMPAFQDIAGHFSTTGVATPVLSAIARNLMKAPAAELPGHRGHTLRSRLLEELLSRVAGRSIQVDGVRELVLAALTSEDQATLRVAAKGVPWRLLEDAEVLRKLVALTGDADPAVVQAAAGQIQYATDAGPGAAEAMEKLMFEHNTAIVAMRYLQRKDVARLEKSIDRLLTKGSFKARQHAATFWLDHKGADGFAKVGPLLTGLGSKDLVLKMGGSMDLRAVPYLLQALKSTNLRTYAQNMLKSIRFYHEEKSKWNKLMAGSGFETQSAAEALIQQFNESDKPAVRLAAIASLGTLGEAETLPFLVKLIGHEDAAVRKAATAAVEKINSASSGGKK